MSKVVGLKVEYSLEVEELHIEDPASQIRAQKVSFSKTMVLFVNLAEKKLVGFQMSIL